MQIYFFGTVANFVYIYLIFYKIKSSEPSHKKLNCSVKCYIFFCLCILEMAIYSCSIFLDAYITYDITFKFSIQSWQFIMKASDNSLSTSKWFCYIKCWKTGLILLSIIWLIDSTLSYMPIIRSLFNISSSLYYSFISVLSAFPFLSDF